MGNKAESLDVILFLGFQGSSVVDLKNGGCVLQRLALVGPVILPRAKDDQLLDSRFARCSKVIVDARQVIEPMTVESVEPVPFQEELQGSLRKQPFFEQEHRGFAEKHR